MVLGYGVWGDSCVSLSGCGIVNSWNFCGILMNFHSPMLPSSTLWKNANPLALLALLQWQNLVNQVWKWCNLTQIFFRMDWNQLWQKYPNSRSYFINISPTEMCNHNDDCGMNSVCVTNVPANDHPYCRCLPGFKGPDCTEGELSDCWIISQNFKLWILTIATVDWIMCVPMKELVIVPHNILDRSVTL